MSRYEDLLVKEPTPNRLYRNADKGVLAGVCAGIADYFGFDANIVRVLVVIATLFFGGPLIPIAYIVLALLLPKDPRPGRIDEEDDSIERRVRTEPHATLATVRHRFRELEGRLQRLEKYVTSERFKLDREFERLKD
jgi:phage shock protein C